MQEVEQALLITDCKWNTVTGDEEEHHIFIKYSVHKDYITVINICIPSNRWLHYIKQKLPEFKGEIDSLKIMVLDCTPRLCKQVEHLVQKVNQEREDLTHTICHLGLTHSCRTPHPTWQNTPSFQTCRELSPGETIYSATEQTSISMKTLKPYKGSFLTLIERDWHEQQKEIRKIHRRGKIKQHPLKQPTFKEGITKEIAKSPETKENKHTQMPRIPHQGAAAGEGPGEDGPGGRLCYIRWGTPGATRSRKRLGRILPVSPWVGTGPVTPRFHTWDPQKHERIRLCCFNPPGCHSLSLQGPC